MNSELVAICDRLTIAEIAMILATDAGWVLPKGCYRVNWRMIQARAAVVVDELPDGTAAVRKVKAA